MIRRAEEKDIKRINELGLLLNENFVKTFDIENILKEDISKIYIYEKDNMVIGFLHVTILYENAYIVNIVVDQNYRNRLIGANLMDTMLGELPKSVKIITLEVSTENEIAINFYKKFGFEIYSIRKHYYKNVDAYLMGRKIYE